MCTLGHRTPLLSLPPRTPLYSWMNSRRVYRVPDKHDPVTLEDYGTAKSLDPASGCTVGNSSGITMIHARSVMKSVAPRSR